MSHYARQMNLFQFDEGSTVADYSNAAVMLLADIVNGSRKRGLNHRGHRFSQKCFSVAL